MQISVMIMSGVEDGALIEFSTDRNGTKASNTWILSIGRKDDNDIVLRHDTFVSRQHAKIHIASDQCILEDCESTNGSFIERPGDYFNDMPVTGKITIRPGQMFRIGRTWMRIQV